MEQITFMDVLTHYQLKLKEVQDEIERIRHQLKRAEQEADAAWEGPAAEACLLKLAALHEDLGKSLTELSETTVRLTAIGELWDQEQIPVF